MVVQNEFGSVTLPDGTVVRFRPVVPDDEPLIADAIRTASSDTLRHRFLIPLRGLQHEELRRLLIIDPTREFCFVGETGQGKGRHVICGARYVRLTDPNKAEIALTVHDAFQREGLGRWMMEKLIEAGRRDGIRVFVAYVLATNESMLQLIRRIAPKRRSRFHSGECEIEFDLVQ